MENALNTYLYGLKLAKIEARLINENRGCTVYVAFMRSGDYRGQYLVTTNSKAFKLTDLVFLALAEDF